MHSKLQTSMYDYNCYIVLLNIKNVFMCSELHYIELEIFLKHLKTAKAPDVKDWADVVETVSSSSDWCV